MYEKCVGQANRCLFASSHVKGCEYRTTKKKLQKKLPKKKDIDKQ